MTYIRNPNPYTINPKYQVKLAGAALDPAAASSVLMMYGSRFRLYAKPPNLWTSEPKTKALDPQPNTNQVKLAGAALDPAALWRS